MKPKKSIHIEYPVDSSKCNHPIKLGQDWFKDWAEMKKTHNQAQCPNCGFWSLWVAK